jgi:hypothetical protein
MNEHILHTYTTYGHCLRKQSIIFVYSEDLVRALGSISRHFPSSSLATDDRTRINRKQDNREYTVNVFTEVNDSYCF